MRKEKIKKTWGKWSEKVASKLKKDEIGIYKIVNDTKEYIYLFEGRI